MKAILPVLVIAILFSGCGKDNPVAPQVDTMPDVTEVLVTGLQIDPVDFATTGAFSIGVIPLDASENPILSQRVGISIALDNDGLALQQTALDVQSKPKHPLATGILVDDSGSMYGNDPATDRATAARMYWEAVLPVRSGNMVGLFDFGRSGCSAPYFRELQSWTDDETMLEAALGNIAPGGNTPLYGAAHWLLNAMEQAVSGADHARALLILSDGLPNCGSETLDDVVSLANGLGVTIHTVGLGPASDLSSTQMASAVDVARALATRTGGVYAAATDPAALLPIFEAMGTGVARGQLLASFQFTGGIPAPGTVVSGTITVASGVTQQTASFSFVVPSGVASNLMTTHAEF